MSKVFDLYRYLKLSGFNKEFGILKTALETTPEELEESFPELFRFYEEGKPTAMFGGVFAQIKKYIQEGYITEQEVSDIQNFEYLKQKMKELKNLKKETQAKFKYLNDYNVEQRFKDLAKERKLSKEDFEFAYKSFISENEDNHQLEQAIAEIADLREKYRLLKEKINTIENNEDLLSRLADPLSYKTLNGASTDINNLTMDVNNIIQGRQSSGLKSKLLNYYDYIYNGENKLDVDYPEERRGKARETSEILYNDGSWAIVNSWSEEACQYWERSAVAIEGDRVEFKTCTSRIKGVHGLTSENMYDSYSGYTMIQVLKLENGQPKFYEGPNEMLTLCFVFANDNFTMKEGSSASVNADDKNLTKEMVKEILPENIYVKLKNAFNGDKKYKLLNFKQLLTSDVPDEIRSKLMLKSIINLAPDLFFLYKENIPRDIFNSYAEIKAEKISPYDFFANINRIPKAIINKLEIEKARDLKAETFFHLKDYIKKSIFNSLAGEKSKELDASSFFNFLNDIPQDTADSLMTQNVKNLSPDDFFANRRKIPEDIFNFFVEEKSVEIDPFTFFRRRGRIPENIYHRYAKDKASQLSSEDFYYLHRKIPTDIFDSLAGEKAKGLGAEDFFNDFYALIPKETIKLLAGEKALYLKPKAFFTFYQTIIPTEVFLPLARKKAMEFSPKEFFEQFKDIYPEEIYYDVAKEQAKLLKPGDFLVTNAYRIPEDVFELYESEKLSEYKDLLKKNPDTINYKDGDSLKVFFNLYKKRPELFDKSNYDEALDKALKLKEHLKYTNTFLDPDDGDEDWNDYIPAYAQTDAAKKYLIPKINDNSNNVEYLKKEIEDSDLFVYLDNETQLELYKKTLDINFLTSKDSWKVVRSGGYDLLKMVVHHLLKDKDYKYLLSLKNKQSQMKDDVIEDVNSVLFERLKNLDPETFFNLLLESDAVEWFDYTADIFLQLKHDFDGDHYYDLSEKIGLLMLENYQKLKDSKLKTIIEDFVVNREKKQVAIQKNSRYKNLSYLFIKYSK